MPAKIILNDVSLSFPIYGVNSSSFKKTVASAVTGGRIGKDTKISIIEALSKININLSSGDRLGIIGHNGAGKSTLLRLLAGVYEPSAGGYSHVGTIASLIDPSMGIEADATGLENIKLRGLMMGLSRFELVNLIDYICEFSGLGDYINMPVRTYSTGMMMRLSFSISTCIKADIVLMDEWLSVGDEIFQLKAEIRMREMLENTGILVLASHSLDLLRRECNKFIHLEHGKIISTSRP